MSTGGAVPLTAVTPEFSASLGQLRRIVADHLATPHMFAGREIAGGERVNDIVGTLCTAINEAGNICPPRFGVPHSVARYSIVSTLCCRAVCSGFMFSEGGFVGAPCDGSKRECDAVMLFSLHIIALTLAAVGVACAIFAFVCVLAGESSDSVLDAIDMARAEQEVQRALVEFDTMLGSTLGEVTNGPIASHTCSSNFMYMSPPPRYP